MRNREIVSLIILLMLSVASIFGANTGAVTAEANQPRYGGTLVVALAANPSYLNPAIATTLYVQFAAGPIFNALVKQDFDLTPLPDLAESWEVSPNGTVYTFHLVKNATWHDGEPFTSADVKFTVENVLIPYHPSGRIIFKSLTSIDTPDPYTVVMKLAYPFPPLLRCLGVNYAAILPKHLYEGTDILKNPYNNEPIGTGPFKFKEWVRGSYIKLVRNNNYFRKGLPYLDGITFTIIPDPTTRVMAFEKREVDYVPLRIPLSEVNRLRAIPGVNITFACQQAMGSQQLILINLRHPALGNVKVRKAIAYAINKTAISQIVTYGFWPPSVAHIHRDIPEYDPNLPQYEYNVTKANQLLDEAGWPRGADGNRFSITIIARMGDEENRLLCLMMIDQLREVGIDLRMEILEATTFTARTFLTWNFDMFINLFSTGVDPQIGIGRVYMSSQILKLPFTNCMGYNNSVVDELFSLAGKTLNMDARKTIFYRIQEILMEDLPTIPITDIWEATGFWEDSWAGLPTDPWGGIRSRTDEVWWKEGSLISAESALQAINEAENKIESLKAQYYDVAAAIAKLDAAKEANNKGDYATAQSLAKEAVGLAVPPYWLYGTVIAVVAIIAVGSLYWYKRRKTTKHSA